MTTSRTRSRVSGGGHFLVKGQGYQKAQSENQPDFDVSATSGVLMASNILPVELEVENEDGYGPINELVDVNRTLERQIETLRLRLGYDARHYEEEKQAIYAETTSKLEAKSEEINLLTSQIQDKDITIRTMSTQNAQRDGKITELKQHIEQLNTEVKGAKTYANDLASELASLTKEKEKLEREGLFGDYDRQVNTLRKEVCDLKLNLTTLEAELTSAREIISSQSVKLSIFESDKKSLQLKFKEELAKVSYSMRLEVEKMRDVMKKQWEEMRELRQQNYSLRKDIKDIRSLLVNSSIDDDVKKQQQQQQQQQIHQHQDGHGQAVPSKLYAGPPTNVPAYGRGGNKVYNNLNKGGQKPALPLINKDRKFHRKL